MLRRLVPATAAVALLLAGATGCSAQQSQAAECESSLAAGAATERLEVTGAFGESPRVEMPEQFEVTSSQRSVVAAGDPEADAAAAGAELLREKALVGVNMAFFDSSTGNKLYESAHFSGGDLEAEYMLLTEEAASPLTESLRCATPGDRLAVAFSPEDGGQLAMQLGADPASPLVAVIDVVSASALSVSGPARGLPNGYPAVTTNADGVPGVVLAPRALPEGVDSAVRIVGDGAEVRAGDTVIAQVLAVDPDAEVPAGAPMSTKAVANTWEGGGPTVIGPETGEQGAESGEALRAELTGKTVGSQVVVLTNSGGKSEVAVVDILGVG